MHTCVMVVTNSGSDVEVFQALAPFEDFDRTDHDSGYLQSVDITEDSRERYSYEIIEQVRDSDGNLHNAWDRRFFTGREELVANHILRCMGVTHVGTRVIPEGWTEVVTRCQDVMTFEAWLDNQRIPKLEGAPDFNGAHRYGYYRLGPDGEVVEVIDRTNPNAQWDYWGGGEIFDFLIPLRTDRGATSWCGYKCDIDWSAMRARAADAAAKRYDLVRPKIEPHLPNFIPYEAMLAKCGDRRAGHEKYFDQLAVHVHRQTLTDGFEPIDGYLLTRDAYIERSVKRSAMPGALVVNGDWYDKDHEQFESLFAEIPDDAYLTIVDCHY